MTDESRVVLHAKYQILIVVAVAVGIWIGEGMLRHAEQSRMDGLYNPTPPAPRVERDCSIEGREICKTRARMEPIKVRKT